jgi:hypothetical protein
VTDIDLPEPTVVAVPPAEEGAPGAGGDDLADAGATAAVGDATPAVDPEVEEVAPTAPATAGEDADAGDEALAEPEPTGVLDLRDLEDDRPGTDRGALASAAADDPFLAELRRAVTDDEPLGPRERVVVDTGGDDLHDDDDLLGPTSVFRRRKRR